MTATPACAIQPAPTWLTEADQIQPLIMPSADLSGCTHSPSGGRHTHTHTQSDNPVGVGFGPCYLTYCSKSNGMPSTSSQSQFITSESGEEICPGLTASVGNIRASHR